MTVFVFFAAFAAAGAGATLIVLDLFRVPSAAASRAAAGMIRQKSGGETALDIRLGALSGLIAGRLRLNANRREILAAGLASAGKAVTPERHVADCIVKTAIAVLPAVPAVFLFPVAVPAVLIFAAAVFSSGYRAPERLSAGRRERIESELPMFCARIESMLTHTRDVVAIIESYRRGAGPELKNELAITLADLRSGDARSALSRLEARVGSPMLSEIVRGLCAVLDGNDPEGYWFNLSLRLSDARRQSLRRMADRIPSRINRLSLCLLLCVLLVYITVIGGEMLRSLGVLFG
jgi:hypothetical protein